MKLDVTSRKVLVLSLGLVTGASLYFLNDLNDRVRETGSAGGLSEGMVTVAGDSAGGAPRDFTPPGSAGGARKDATGAAPLRMLTVESDAQGPRIRGQRLSPKRSEWNPYADRGRTAVLKATGFAAWRDLYAGSEVLLPSFDGEGFAGVVALSVEESGWVRMGGELRDVRGTFALHTNFREVRGNVLLQDAQVAYEISTDSAGEVVMVERPMEALLCVKFRPPTRLPQQLPAETAVGATVAQGAAVPELNTRPGARGVVFLDFDGAQVSDPSWNGGRLITAAPSSLTPDQIRAVVDSVAEDFAPFDLTITTSQTVYDGAAIGRRIRAIITPTSTAAPGSGGVAYVNSWSQAGRAFSSSITCWIFNEGVKTAADTISHEVGHTLGLYHDGSTALGEYYEGHGGDLSVPTSWGPIMGAPFSRSLTQWSRGEYAGANNTQDDLFVIARDQNGFGYRSDMNGSVALTDTVRALETSGGAFDVLGLIRRSDLLEMHQFSTAGGTLSASVRPYADRTANVDLRVEVRDATGATLAFSSPTETLGASVVRELPAGTYWLVVAAAGTGDKPLRGYTSGYSAYGSLGAYRLTGTLSNSTVTPVLPPSGSAFGVVGEPFQYVFSFSPGVTITGTPGPLPPGVVFDAGRVALVGTPTEPGVWPVQIGVTNGTSSAQGVLQINIESPLITLASGIDERRGLRTSFSAPWVGVWMPRADGAAGPVAASGLVGDGAASAVQFFAKGPTQMSYWWKVSSEASKDMLECYVNGQRAVNAADGMPLSVSGETDWTSVRVDLPLRGRNVVEFRYSKDSALRAGSDRGWVYGVQIQPRLPKFRAQPRLVAGGRGAPSLRIVADVEEAASYEWKLNGVTVSNVSGTARAISGAGTTELCIKGATAADAGSYQLVARNASGTSVSIPVQVELATPPVFVQPPVAPAGLKTGETLRLTAQVAGAGPVDYAWFKDGRLMLRSKTPVLEVGTGDGKASGAYTVVATNRYGSATATAVRVQTR